MGIFQENLKRIRGERGFKSAKQFAATLGIGYTRYINYENKGREPDFETLCQIADALHVTTDELLGHPSPDNYETCKKRLSDIGLDIYTRADGKILVRLGEKGHKDEELKRIYDTANIKSLEFPNKSVFLEIVKNAEVSAMQASFREALILRLLPWFITAEKPALKKACAYQTERSATHE